ncbi:MAG: hypothetical protein QFX36_03590 [Archaeoglobales archaeon]|nr:hypothetical protein [Archaeoglobales archaeon]
MELFAVGRKYIAPIDEFIVPKIPIGHIVEYFEITAIVDEGAIILLQIDAKDVHFSL